MRLLVHVRRRSLLLGILLLAAGLPPATPRLSSHREDTVELLIGREATSRAQDSRGNDEAAGAGEEHQPQEEQGQTGRGLADLQMLVSGTEGDVTNTEQLGYPLVPGGGDARDYLNGLVSASVALTETQLCNIAFIKTHKTASTTLAYLLFRYGRRHDKKLAYFDDHNSAIPLPEAVTQTKQGKGRVDIMHYHMSVFGQYEGTWNEAEDYYRRIMRDSEKVNFITVMREPRNHLLSYYYYFIQPKTKKSIQSFLQQQSGDKVNSRLFNPLSAEFGIRTRGEMESLIADVLPHFKLVILTEEFDEGMMVLRRLLGWAMIDMTYSSMYKTKKGSTRFDGKQLVDVPHFDDLPKQTRDAIDGLTQLDQMLYSAAKKEYQMRRDSVAGFLGSDLVEFNELQRVVTGYLDANTSSMANAMYKTSNIYAEKSQLFDF